MGRYEWAGIQQSTFKDGAETLTFDLTLGRNRFKFRPRVELSTLWFRGKWDTYTSQSNDHYRRQRENLHFQSFDESIAPCLHPQSAPNSVGVSDKSITAF